MKATIVVAGETREVSAYKGPKGALKNPGVSNRVARWTEVAVPVNGTPVKLKVTSNKGWAGGAPSIEYAWFDVSGSPYWVSLAYGEKVEQIESIVTSEGSAVKMTARVTSRTHEEEVRVALGRRTWYTNRTIDLPDDLKADLKRLGLVKEEEAPTEPKKSKVKA